jgi:hypothetical protein
LPSPGFDRDTKALFGSFLASSFREKQFAFQTVQLGLVDAVVVLVRNGQTFVQHVKRIFETRVLGERVANHTQVAWDADFGTRCPKLAQAFKQERNRFSSSALKQQGTAGMQRAQRSPERKSLLGPDCEFFFGSLKEAIRDPTALLMESTEVNGMSQAEGVAERAS